jgi:hypothetical protein
LTRVGERPEAQIARELGILVNQLRKWQLEFEQEERTGAPKRLPLVDEDLARLGSGAARGAERVGLRRRRGEFRVAKAGDGPTFIGWC